MENTMEQNYSIADVLNKIAESQKKYSFPIFIPSLNREVPFHQMTTAQQKVFIKASMSDNKRYSNTMYALFSVIQTNIADKTVDVSKFTVLDKLIIALAIRAYSVSPEYRVQVNDIKHDDGTPVTAKIDLGALISKIIKSFKGKKFTQTISVDSVNIQATISLPTIGTEVEIERQFEEKARDDAQNGETEDDKSAGLGELYILECVKFLSTVIVKNEDGSTTEMDVSRMNAADKKAAFEQLPASLSVKIAEYVNQILSDLGNITMLKIKAEDGTHEYKIDAADPDFFIGS